MALMWFSTQASAQPTTGAYVYAYSRGGTTLTTSPIDTQTSGSTILVWVACGTSGDLSAVPTDNKGNTYVGLGIHTFAPNYAPEGDQMYVCTNAVGGTGHTFTFTVPPDPEFQIVALEIENGGAVQDVEYDTVLSPNANTSANVTATGPATLVALWAGDAGGDNFTAVPNNSFTVIQSFLTLPDNYGFQFAEATRNVTAGTYNVTWSETPTEGAHLWMVAVQGNDPTISVQPTSQSADVGQTATFSVTASGQTSLSYQWQTNGVNVSGATSASWTTPALTHAWNGLSVDVKVTDTAGTVESSVVTLTVNADPVISVQPTSQTSHVGETATFAVTASGQTTLSYQWQTNGVNVSGATSSSWTTPTLTAGWNGLSIDANVTDASGTLKSSVVSLTVNIDPSITAQPQSVAVSAGGTATFSVAASGQTTLSYQWQTNGVNVSGATSASWTTPTLTTAWSGLSVDVVVHDTAGSLPSSTVTLTVTAAPSAQPTTGAHVYAYSRGGTTLTTSPINTQTSGSTILVWVACGTSGDLSAVPTDNKGNTYVGLGIHTFAPNYAPEGDQMYVCANAVGGTGHTFSFTVPPEPEFQIVALEIENGGAVQDVEYDTVLSPNANTSANVTATGPATLVALWAGDAGGDSFTAVPNNSFNVIQSFLTLSGGYGFQFAEATRNVTAGTYNVTWSETPTEGAHLWLVAVQQGLTQGPAVTISSPANGATLTSPSLVVSGTATDSGRGNDGVSSVTVNGVSATGGTASGSGTANWSATITLTPGQNTITAVAYDTLNNAGQQQITVTYTPPAAQGPAVTISSPANGATLTNPSLRVRGTATDSGRGNNGVASVTVNGVSATGGTASGSGTADWSATITLTPGQNTITAVAYDTLNNTGQQQITVTYARRLHNASVVIVVPPSVEITDPMLAGNGQFQFTFNSTFGTQYTVQSSTNLIDWDFVQELSGSGGPLTGIDSNATGKGPRFYRVMVGRP
jgi:hypothetical protein